MTDAVERLLRTRTWSEARAVVEAHPELLAPAAEGALRGRSGGAAEGVEELLAILARCRAVGVEAAFADRAAARDDPRYAAGPVVARPTPEESGVFRVPPEFENDVEQLNRLAASGRPVELEAIRELLEGMIGRDMPPGYLPFRAGLLERLGLLYGHRRGDRVENISRAVALFRQQLEITPTDDPDARARVLNNLGNAYFDLPARDRGATLAEAVRCYREAMDLLTAYDGDLNRRAAVLTNLGLASYFLPSGHRDENIREAIRCFEEALRYRDTEGDRLAQAATLTHLADAYIELPTGDPADNLRRAVALFEQALKYRTLADAPAEYAATLNSLGRAYSHLPDGDRAANLEQAIACYDKALAVYTAESSPFGYAAAQTNRGLALASLPTGDRNANLRRALECYEQALRIYTATSAPQEYAAVQLNRGLALAGLTTADAADRIEEAVGCLREVTAVFTPATAPFHHAVALNALGGVYRRRRRGDRAENVRQAILCFQQALQVQTREAAPREYATVCVNFGNALLDWADGDRAENLRMAAGCFQDALEVYQADTAPEDHALALAGLGNAFAELAELGLEDAATCSEEAIACYEASLSRRPPDAVGFARALTCNNLGTVYVGRRHGDRVENLRAALRYFDEALKVRTPERAPGEYAMTQNSRGIALRELAAATGELAHAERAVECLEDALRYRPVDGDPIGCRMTARNLARLRLARREWADARRAADLGIAAGDHLFRAGLSARRRRKEVAETAVLYQTAAFAAVQLGDVPAAAVALEQGKTRVLADALRVRAAGAERPAGVPDAVWDRFRRAAAAVRTAVEEGGR